MFLDFLSTNFLDSRSINLDLAACLTTGLYSLLVSRNKYSHSWYTQALLLFSLSFLFAMRHETTSIVLLIILGSFCSNHLSKQSKYVRGTETIVTKGGITFTPKVDVTLRPWTDPLVLSNGIYIIASLFAAYHYQFYLALLCCITGSFSTMYHRHRESKFFNGDHVFASSLMFIFVWSMYLAYQNKEVDDFHHTYYMLGCLGMPTAFFLICACGMPAKITILQGKGESSGIVGHFKGGLCCMRSDRPIYNYIHTLWHLFSGLGPLITVYFFAVAYKHPSHDQHTVLGSNIYLLNIPSSTIRWFPIVPTLSLVGGIAFNAFATAIGAAPLD